MLEPTLPDIKYCLISLV